MCFQAMELSLSLNCFTDAKLICFVFRGPSLIDYFDTLPPCSRALDKPLRMPVVDRYKVRKLCLQK